MYKSLTLPKAETTLNGIDTVRYIGKIEFVGSELPAHHDEEQGKDLLCSKLAQKVEMHWKSPSVSSASKVFKKHKQPANLEGLVVPPTPKILWKT